MPVYSRLYRACLGICLLFLCGASLAAPRVAVSIPPLHSLVNALMDGIATPELVLEGGSSPHHAALSPSQVALLEQAELVVWVGPQLETGLVRAAANRDPQMTLTLLALADAPLLPQRSPHLHHKHDGHEEDDEHGEHEGHAGHDDHAEHDHDDHKHEKKEHPEPDGEVMDPHLWLAATTASWVADAVFQKLVSLDGGNRDRYTANLNALQTRLADWRAQTAERLAPVVDVPFMVFHDAYQYFEEEFSLNAHASVTSNAERSVGARRLMALRSEVVEQDVRCLFSEPQFVPRATEVVREGTSARAGTLDPLGAGLTPGADLWFELMDKLVDDFLDCMTA